MSDRPDPHHIEIKDGEDQTIAAAEVTASADREAARASLYAAPGHAPRGIRARLVDAVMDVPEVQECARLEAAVPRGDAEALERIRERTDDVETRQAGATVLLDASIRPLSEPEPDTGEPGPPERPGSNVI
jgi:hypothetical protein